MKKLNSKGFSHDVALMFFVLIFAIVGIGYLVASHAATNSFVSLGTDPAAAVQPTAWGKTIQALAVWNGQIYAGYGDYNTNTGPIALIPLNPNTKTFASSAENAPCDYSVYPATGAGCDLTEEIDNFRLINGNLYAPSIDPRYAVSTDYIEAFLVNGVPTWTQHQVLPGGVFQHTFDMTTLTGSDLWQVGSYVPGDYVGTTTPNTKAAAYATAFRSTDGGTTWQQQTQVTVGPNLNTCTICDVRYYMAGVYTVPGTNDPKLYLQPMDANSGLASYSWVFDSASGTWSKGPNFPAAGGYPAQFAGLMVYLGGAGQIGSWPMFTFNGTSSTQVNIGGVYSYYIDGSTLYALTGNNDIYSTTDLVNWSNDGTAPTTARSIAVYNGQIYVGTTDSQIYTEPIPSSTTAVSTGGSGSGTSSHGGGHTSTGGGGGKNHK